METAPAPRRTRSFRAVQTVLGVGILLYTGGTETIAVAIFRLNDLGQLEVVAERRLCL